MNTPQSGSYRWMVFKEGDTWYGAALEFNIVVDGDDPRVVEIELQEAVRGYIEAAKKLKGFRANQVNSILNQKPDTEYEEKWVKATQARSTSEKAGVPSPLSHIYRAGVASLATV